MTMDLEEALAAIGETDTLDTVRPHWDASCAAMPEGGPAFLLPDVYRQCREWAGLDAKADVVLDQAAARIADDPALLHLAWHASWCLHHAEDVASFKGWPELEEAMGELAGAFYLLVGLSVVPTVRELHERMGVCDKVSRDTCSQLKQVAARYAYANNGRVGVDTRVLYWYRHYINGDLFRVGRMEYMIRPFRGGLVAYRNGEAGQVVALAEDGDRFDAEGQVANDETANAWTATATCSRCTFPAAAA